MLNALIYTRVSTEKQEFERQIYELTNFANKENYNLLGVFSDKISGVVEAETREGFKLLQSFIETSGKKIDIVLTSEVSRIGRDFLQNINTAYYFLGKGINLYSLKDNFYALDSDGNIRPDFNIRLSINADISDKERTTLISRIKSGISYKVYNGGLNNGAASGNSTAYGYNNTNKKLVINEVEAKTVKYIFNQYNNGISVQNIAKSLNVQGIKPKRNNKFNNWSDGTVYNILKNRIYIGERYYNGEYLKADTLKLLPKTSFEKAQLRLSNKTNKQAINQTYINPLQNLVYCSACGLPYIHRIHLKSNAFQYICSSNKHNYRGVKCDNIGVNIPFLNSLVYEHIRNNQIRIEDINKQLQDVNNQINNLVLVVNNIENDLKKFNKQSENLLELRINDTISLDQYNTRLSKINTTINKAETELKYNSSKLIELKDFRKQVKNSKSIKLDTNTFKDNIKQLVKRIEVIPFNGIVNGEEIKHWFKTRTFQITLEFIDGKKSVYYCAQNNWKAFKQTKVNNKSYVHPIPQYFTISDFIPK